MPLPYQLPAEKNLSTLETFQPVEVLGCLEEHARRLEQLHAELLHVYALKEIFAELQDLAFRALSAAVQQWTLTGPECAAGSAIAGCLEQIAAIRSRVTGQEEIFPNRSRPGKPFSRRPDESSVLQQHCSAALQALQASLIALQTETSQDHAARAGALEGIQSALRLLAGSASKASARIDVLEFQMEQAEIQFYLLETLWTANGGTNLDDLLVDLSCRSRIYQTAVDLNQHTMRLLSNISRLDSGQLDERSSHDMKARRNLQ